MGLLSVRANACRGGSHYVQKAANVLSMISGEAKQLSQNWNSMQPPSMLYGQSNRLQAGASAIGTSQSDGFHTFAVTTVSVVEKTRSQPSHGLSICNLRLKHNGYQHQG